MTDQYGRRVSLIVNRPASQGLNPYEYIPESSLDLSQLHIQFKTENQDDEGPSNCSIRVFNLSEATQQKIIKEFSRVILQAGYKDQFGVIFDGTIKQFRTGRLSATDTYFDILAADGDIGYNFAIVNTSLAAGTTSAQARAQAAEAFKQYGLVIGKDLAETGGVLPRGKVMFGMARAYMRTECESKGCTWSIQNGQIQIIPLDGYLPGEAVKLTAATGLIGLPEQTQDGVKIRCLINPRIIVGGRVQIDNKSINKTTAQQSNFANIPANQWAQPTFLATIAEDGFYRVYVSEFTGDTRGQDWYQDLVCLAIDNSTQKVIGK